MNKIYRLVVSKNRGQLVAVSEIAKGTGKAATIGHVVSEQSLLTTLADQLYKISTLLLLTAFLPASLQAAELPGGGTVSVGSGTIGSNGNTMTIQQNSQHLGINWQSFSIGAGNTVRFNQPGSDAIALNRVQGGSRSEIFGNLSANGQVFLVNPNGILFGKTAEVNVGGLLATSKNLSDGDFLSGNYTLTGGHGDVINQGNLRAADGGFIVLAGDKVVNDGTITAAAGNVALASGETVSLDFDQSGQLKIDVDGNTLQALIENRGLIEASGGSVVLTAAGKEMLAESAINLSGIVRATSLDGSGGSITIDGDRVQVANAIVDASGGRSGEKGGTITITGKTIATAGNTVLTAAGDGGGGSVRIGGEYRGQDGLRKAETVSIGEGTSIDVSAKNQGNGGLAVLWSEGQTTFSGEITATGGHSGGDGGTVETSSRKTLHALGKVRAEAPQGKAGSWLLDPENVIFVDESTTAPPSTSGDPQPSQINADNVNSQAAAGTTVVVETASGTTPVTPEQPAVVAATPAPTTPTSSSTENEKEETPSGQTSETTSPPLTSGTPVAATPTPTTDILPTGGQVFAGTGTIATSGATMTVQQQSEKMGVNWQSFNIGTNNSVVFNQPNANAVALNRVLGGDRSEIYGKLQANGKVYLYNPSGMLFAPSAEINVGSLSTSDLSDHEFSIGTYTTPASAGEVINQGNITSEHGGTIELTGSSVTNEGTITANGGTVALTSVANTVPATSTLLAEAIGAVSTGGQIDNKGSIAADGGKISIAAIGNDPAHEGSINLSGILQARSIGDSTGSIAIDGGNGHVSLANGTIDVSGLADGERGGEVTVIGKDIDISGTSTIDARGDAGGGTALIGGDYQGQGSLAHAETVSMEKDAKIDASAVTGGDGGKVVLWSDGRTGFDGSITSQGGSLSGDGGLVETSGKTLQVGESAHVDTRAEQGTTGNWLLDPNNYTIASSGGNISGATLSSSLGSSNVTIRTSTMGTAGGNGDIFVNDAVSWSSIYRLTLEAERNVAVNRAISASNSNSSFYVQAPEMLTISGTGSARAGNVNYSIGDASFTGSTTTTGTRLFIGSHGPRQIRIESSATTGALSLTPTELATLHAQNSGDLNLSGDGLVISTALSSSRVDAGHFSLHSRADIDVNASIDLSPSSTALHFITDDNVHLNSSIKAQGITLEGRIDQAPSAHLTANWLEITGIGGSLGNTSIDSLRGNATGTIWLHNGFKALSVDGGGVRAGNVGIYTNGALTLNAPITATGTGVISPGSPKWTDPLCTGSCRQPFIDLNGYEFYNNYGASALTTQPGEFWSLQTNDPVTTNLGGLTPYIASYDTPIVTGNILLSSNRVFYRQPGGTSTPPPTSTSVENPLPNRLEQIIPQKVDNGTSISSSTNDSSKVKFLPTNPPPLVTQKSTPTLLDVYTINPNLDANKKTILLIGSIPENFPILASSEQPIALKSHDINNIKTFPKLQGSKDDASRLEHFLQSLCAPGTDATWVTFITTIHNMFSIPDPSTNQFSKYFSVKQLSRAKEIQKEFVAVIKDITELPNFKSMTSSIVKGTAVNWITQEITNRLKKKFPDEGSLKDSFTCLAIDIASSAVTNAISAGTSAGKINYPAMKIYWQIGMIADMSYMTAVQSGKLLLKINENKSTYKETYNNILDSYIRGLNVQVKAIELTQIVNKNSELPKETKSLLITKVNRLQTISFEQRYSASEILEEVIDSKGFWTELKLKAGGTSNKISQTEAITALSTASQIKERMNSSTTSQVSRDKDVAFLKAISSNLKNNHQGSSGKIIKASRDLVEAFGNDYWKSLARIYLL